MRLKDIEHAILLEDKLRLYAACLMDSGARSITESKSAQDFLANFGSFKELITDNCDNIEANTRIFHTIQETSKLASNLHKAATGCELPSCSFGSTDEAHKNQNQLTKLPMRAETYVTTQMCHKFTKYWKKCITVLVGSMNIVRSNNIRTITIINLKIIYRKIRMMTFF